MNEMIYLVNIYEAALRSQWSPCTLRLSYCQHPTSEGTFVEAEESRWTHHQHHPRLPIYIRIYSCRSAFQGLSGV